MYRFNYRRLIFLLLAFCLLISLISCAGGPSDTQPTVLTTATTSLEPITSSTPVVTATPSITAGPTETATPAATVTPTIAITPIATVTPTATVTSRPSPTAVPPDPSLAIHRNALVIDTHNDTVLKIIDKDSWLPRFNIASPTGFMVDIPKLQAGGIDLATFASYTSGYSLTSGGQNFTRANSRLLALINAGHWTLAKNSSSTRQILRFSDIAAAVDEGKTGILLSIEGAYSLHGDTAINLLRQYRDLGILMLAPVWSNSNALGAGVNEKYQDGTPAAGGLTSSGFAVIAEMNRLGMVIDVSHMNEATFWDTIGASTAPVIASHSSVYALCANVRNLKDGQIKAIAAGGGVIQVNFHRPFLAADESKATLQTLADHIDYIVKLVGIDYVGLGSDFDGAKMPEGLPDASAYPKITQELYRRGYSQADLEKILGGNVARVFEKVWGMAPAIADGAPTITPSLEMGAKVDTTTPVLTATLSSTAGLDLTSLQITVDGVVYTPDFTELYSTISLTLPTALSEKFHVATFSASNSGGAIARKTIIIYID